MGYPLSAFTASTIITPRTGTGLCQKIAYEPSIIAVELNPFEVIQWWIPLDGKKGSILEPNILMIICGGNDRGFRVTHMIEYIDHPSNFIDHLCILYMAFMGLRCPSIFVMI